MKKKFLIGCGAIIFLLILGGVSIFYWVFGDMIGQMRAGARYMDSLSLSDRAAWISKTEEFLDANIQTNKTPRAWIQLGDVPEELRQLRIKRIDVSETYVRYVWCGGLDHTALTVERTPQGTFRFYAQYSDDHGRELWPENTSDKHNIFEQDNAAYPEPATRF